jgi:hypothetical protein
MSGLCPGGYKRAFTRKKAVRMRDALQRKATHRLSVYQCHRCGRWHLTSRRAA